MHHGYNAKGDALERTFFYFIYLFILFYFGSLHKTQIATSETRGDVLRDRKPQRYGTLEQFSYVIHPTNPSLATLAKGPRPTTRFQLQRRVCTKGVVDLSWRGEQDPKRKSH